jgi:hypothetical protein
MKIPHKIKLLLCFLRGHNTTKLLDIDAPYCSRCSQFIKPNYHGIGLDIAAFLIRLSAFWTLSGILALIIIGFMVDFGLWR